MSKHEKTKAKVADTRQRQNIRYKELMVLLAQLGYRLEQISTSHVSVRFPGMLRPLVIVRQNNGMVEDYQVDQVRKELKRRELI